LLSRLLSRSRNKKKSRKLDQLSPPDPKERHTHRLSPAKSVASLYKSASKLARNRSRSSSQATVVSSPSTNTTSQTVTSSTKTATKKAHKKEKNTESTPYQSKIPVNSPVSEASTAVESLSFSYDLNLNDSSLSGKSIKSSSQVFDPPQDPFPITSTKTFISEKEVQPNQSNSEISEMSTPVEKNIHTAADEVKKATAPSTTEALKDKAKKASSSIKENATKASSSIKENASKASKEADNFFKKVISAFASGFSNVASTTESVVLSYPVATSNLAAILSAGLTTLLFQKTCPRYTPKCPTKHLYGGVFSIVASTLAVVDSFAIYYIHKKQLTN